VVIAGMQLVLQTDTWTLHFRPTDNLKSTQGPRYLINLPVLAPQYSDDQVRHLDSYTELKTIASINMPKIKITFHEGDPLFNKKLDTVLNQTDQDKELYASVYRDPEFINKLRVTTAYDVTELASLVPAILSITGIVYLLIKVRKLNMAIMVIQSQLTTAVRALDELQLTHSPSPTEPTRPNIHETILNISKNYWFYLVAILLVIAICRKASKVIWKRCTYMLSKRITESSIILYISNGVDIIYLKIQDTQGRPQNLNIQSATYLDKAEIIGYFSPILKYNWKASAINILDQQTTSIEEAKRLSQYEAYLTRRVLRKDFHCHLLLLPDNKLDIIARINDQILPASQKQATKQAQ